MPAANDPSPLLREYAHPGRLVTTEWLSANIGNPHVKVIECDEDPGLYDIGHVPGAVKLDWQRDLNNPLTRDCIDGTAFAELMRAKGIERDDTVVLYGDKNNRWAAYALWVFALFGHEDARLLVGGRNAWMTEDRDTTLDVPHLAVTTKYPVVKRDDKTSRIFAGEVIRSNAQLIDVRTREEFAGDTITAARGGHIPSAHNLPWAEFFSPIGRFLPVEQLRSLVGPEIDPAAAVVVYCHTGEQAAHIWFALTHLLGFSRVRVYDGSWIEWGNAVRVPIERGVPEK